MDGERKDATPSRLRPPQAKLGAVPAVLSGAIKAGENTNTNGNVAPKRTLPAAQVVAADGGRVVKTYRASGATTAAPVSAADARRATTFAALNTTNSRPTLNITTNSSSRLEGMERIIQEMQARLEATEGAKEQQRVDDAALVAARSEVESLTTRLATKERVVDELDAELRVLRRRLDSANDDATAKILMAERRAQEEQVELRKALALARDDADARVREVQRQCANDLQAAGVALAAAKEEALTLAAQCGRLSAELSVAREEAATLRHALARASASTVEVQAAMSTLGAERDAAAHEAQRLQALLCDAHGQIANAIDSQALLKQKLEEGDAVRRRLHNMVMELRGNIRVICRVRPLLNTEGANDTPVRVPQDGGKYDGMGEEVTVSTVAESVTGAAQTRDHTFTFDRVFGPAATNATVFDEIAQLVQSAIDGYRVCIFAYGQTGSGKTHTMEGSWEEPGVIPRAVRLIFASVGALRERGWVFAMDATYLEIYNEAIRDLLNGGPRGDSRYDIRHSVDGRTTVSDACIAPVTDEDAIMGLLRRAASSRAVGGTACNERSSRSHSVFTLRISATNAEGSKSEGVLNLVDLAGSERLSESKATGDRLKETQAINKSLSALGDVIAALQTNGSGGHVPYRNSKLTYLLQTSLGGSSSKTLMFVNVSPATASAPETLCSLRFAAKVNAVHLGAACRQSATRLETQ